MVKIAIIGTGISGMIAAHYLAKKYKITVFEANDYIGGHSNTVDILYQGKNYPVDTGFIVYNDVTYPNFSKLLTQLKVKTENSRMSFGIKSEVNGLEYSTNSINGLFAQRSNLFNPSFYRLFLDVMRFHRESTKLLEANTNIRSREKISLAKYLRDMKYSDEFREYYLIPMAASIWSAKRSTIEDFPILYLLRFFKNHGILSNYRHHQWKTVSGGSRQYVQKLTANFANNIRLNCPVLSIKRFKNHVAVDSKKYGTEKFDHVVIATHSDQALRMLKDPTLDEEKVLGAIDYQENEAILHTDESVLPASKRAWASWNYHIFKDRHQHPASLTYYMNRLQNIEASKAFCVTLNYPKKIAQRHIIKKILYHHPVLTPSALAAQKKHAKINGQHRTYYCGAYWGNGFHEDGFKSALKVIDKIKKNMRMLQFNQRAGHKK